MLLFLGYKNEKFLVFHFVLLSLNRNFAKETPNLMLCMMKKTTNICLMLALTLMSWLNAGAQECNGCKKGYELPKGKAIYIPEELQSNDFTNPDSKWSYYRMASTENVVVFWEKGFGSDLSKAPDLEGHKMTVDLQNLLARLEFFYQTYRDEFKFTLPGSKADSLRMMVMLNYSLEGTAYGGCYDNVIGALWIAPNRVQDKKLNCIAHEIGHSFQIQIACDGRGHGLGGGIYEMCSQWMLWQVNPEWTTDENYHWEAFRKLFHLRFLAGENIYHSPYVLEYWSTKHGVRVIADLFREGREREDIAQAYMRMFNLSLPQMADEMYDCYSRLITFDFPRVKASHKKYACQLETPVTTEGKAVKPQTDFVPQTYGFNVVPLPLKASTVQFKGLGDKVKDAYRWGVVLVDNDMNATYLPMQNSFSGKVSYKPAATTQKAYLVVVGCPADQYGYQAGNPYERREKTPERTYPYQITVK